MRQRERDELDSQDQEDQDSDDQDMEDEDDLDEEDDGSVIEKSAKKTKSEKLIGKRERPVSKEK